MPPRHVSRSQTTSFIPSNPPKSLLLLPLTHRQTSTAPLPPPRTQKSLQQAQLVAACSWGRGRLLGGGLDEWMEAGGEREI